MKPNTPTQIGSYSAQGDKILRQMAQDEQMFTAYMKYHGRVFKHPSSISLEFFVQKPDATFIGSEKQWQNQGFTIGAGEEAIHFRDRNGNVIALYDFSQTTQEFQPSVWTVHSGNADAVKRALNIPPDQHLMSTLASQTINQARITASMAALGIPASQYNAYARSFQSAVMLMMAGRLELGTGQTFRIRPDLGGFRLLDTNEQRIAFLAHTASAAREALMNIERAVQSLQTLEQLERMDYHDEVRGMDETDGRAAGADAGRGSAGGTDRDAAERADHGEGDATERRTGLERDTDGGRQGENAVPAEVEVQRAERDDAVVETGRTGGDVSPLRGDRAVAGAGAAGDLRSEVETLDGEQLSGSGGMDVLPGDLPDHGTVAGDGSGRVLRSSGGAIQPGESETEGLQRDAGLGADEGGRTGFGGDAGRAADTGNGTEPEVSAQSAGAGDAEVQPVSEGGVSDTIFTVNGNGERRFFKANAQISAEDILRAVANTDHNPQFDELGVALSEAAFAEIEQSVTLGISVDIDLDHQTADIFEVNGGRGGVADPDRTSENFTAYHVSLDQYKPIQTVSEPENPAPAEPSPVPAAPVEKELPEDYAERIHAAFNMIRSNPERGYSERQLKFLQRLEVFAVQKRVTEDLVDEALKLSVFKSTYGNRKHLSQLFNARLGRLENDIEDAMDAAFADAEKHEAVHDQATEQAHGTFEIYQMKSGEQYHYNRFESYESNKDAGLTMADYDLVYSGNLADYPADNVLEAIFDRFNLDIPEDFRGHSLSMSDVVVMTVDGEKKAFYCDKMDYKEFPGFFNEKKPVEEQVTAEEPTETDSAGSIPVYTGEWEIAENRDLYWQIRDENERFAARAREVIDNGRNPVESMKTLTEEFGFERTAYLTALNIIAHPGDGRFYQDQKQWACDLLAPYLEVQPDEVLRYGTEKQQLFDRMINGGTLYSIHNTHLSQFAEVLIPEYTRYLEQKQAAKMEDTATEQTPTEYHIHFGLLGNGITAYDVSRTDPETHDYPNVAHISEEGNVTFYDQDLSVADVDYINHEAERQRAKFEADWNSYSIEGRYDLIVSRSMDHLPFAQAKQIRDEKLPIEEIVKKYEHSVIFMDEPFPEESRMYQLVTNAGSDGGFDEKKNYATLEEAVKAGRDYIADGYLGFSVLNTDTKIIEHTEGDFPVGRAFSEDILKQNGILPEPKPVVTDQADETFEQMSLLDEPEPVSFDALLSAEIDRGTGFENGKLRVQAFYDTQNPTTNELAKFLKDAYGIGGHSGDENVRFVQTDGSGMHFEMQDGEDHRFSWQAVAKAAEEKLHDGTYLNADERTAYEKMLADRTPEVAVAEEVDTNVNSEPLHMVALTPEEQQFLEDYPELDEPEISPWGEVDQCRTLYKGVFEVQTPSHGGVIIEEELADCILSPEAREIGFVEGGYHCYEEDCDAQVVLRELIAKGLLDLDAYVQQYHEPNTGETKQNWMLRMLDESNERFHPEYAAAFQQQLTQANDARLQADAARVAQSAGEYYDKLYGHDAEYSDYQTAMETGQAYWNDHPDFAKAYYAAANDAPTSDRELAALGYALAKEGLVEDFRSAADRIKAAAPVEDKTEPGAWFVATGTSQDGNTYGYVARKKDPNGGDTGKNMEYCNTYFDDTAQNGMTTAYAQQLADRLNADGVTALEEARAFVAFEVAGFDEITAAPSDSISDAGKDATEQDALTPEPKPKHGKTIGERLYDKLEQMFPEILNGNHIYERYGEHDSESGYEPISVEHLGGDKYGFMTSYVLNGDLMRDPDFTFHVDKENRTVVMSEFQMDGVPGIGTVYQHVEQEDGSLDLHLERELAKNFLQNLRNADPNRMLTAYTDANGEERHVVPVSPEDPAEVQEEPETLEPYAEFREMLNQFSQENGLGELRLKVEGSSTYCYAKVLEVFNGAEEPIDIGFTGAFYGDLNPFTLQERLNQWIDRCKEQGDTLPSETPAHQAMEQHYGLSELPKVPDSLPQIVYARNPSQKLRDNVEAIRELKRLKEAEESGAELYVKKHPKYAAEKTKEESDEILRKYSGWGGLQEYFAPNGKQQNSYNAKQLREILTDEEYEACRATVTDAHYTPQFIVDAMYQAIKTMGLSEDARILEPSCGTGNFISRMPAGIGNGGVVGVEIDPITAEMARFLHNGDSRVQIVNSGFERTDLPNNSFDLAIGNVPFGNYRLFDPDYPQNWQIHDSFFRRALDKIASGGVVAFITDKGTMDKQSPKIREYLATQAELVGAVRLPNTAFADAGTGVTSDIIFLKKREHPLQPHEAKPDWCYVKPNADGLTINSFFVDNPQMMLGTMKQTTFQNRLTCEPIPDADLRVQLRHAMQQIRTKITIQNREMAAQKRQGIIEPWGKNDSYQYQDGKFYFRSGDHMDEIKVPEKHADKMKQLIALRDTIRELLDKQTTHVPDAALEPLRQQLNAQYDTYVKQYGTLHESASNLGRGVKLSADIDYPVMMALEDVDPDTCEITKAAIFTERTVNPVAEITSVETLDEAFVVSMDQRGKVDIPYMETLLMNTYGEPGKGLDEICTEVLDEMLDKGMVYIDPEQHLPGLPYSGIVEPAEYLSGNVRRKLTMAQEAAKRNPETYTRNVEALTEVIPEDIHAEEITCRIGCTWVDAADYEAFLCELSGRSENDYKHQVSFSPQSGAFDILHAASQADLNPNETTTYGTKELTMYQIAEALMNQRRIQVLKTIADPMDPSKTITRTDAKATKRAHEKAEQIAKKFEEWIFATPERKKKYERIYNDRFNSIVGRTYDGSHLTFNGMANDFHLLPHQMNCVARTVYGGNTLAAHVVGAGKSAIISSTVMKKKQLGLISKACVVVPKPLTEQTAREWRRVFPDAKLLTVTNMDLSTEEKRKAFTAKIATGNYDAVIMSQEQFEKMPMSKEYQSAYIRERLSELRTMLDARMEVCGHKKRDFTVRALETLIKREKERLEAITNPKSKSKAKDQLLDFEALGFDYLVVDEAHSYKNGFVATKMTNVSGVNTAASGRAQDMQMKCDYFNQQLGQGHILYSTGTPVSNSMTEMYVMTRYLRPDLLERAGVSNFDEWAATFGRTITSYQQDAAGRLKLKTSFAKFANLPELMAMYKEFADIQSAEKLHLPRPELKGGKPQIIKVEASPEQRAYVKELAARAKAIQDGRVRPNVDNLLKITGEARMIGMGNQAIAALYKQRGMELPPDFTMDTGSKVDACVDQVKALYDESSETKGVQIVFSDIAVNGDDTHFSVYDYIRDQLIAKGVPADEIVFAPKSDSKEREQVFRDINDSKYRVVIASTGTLGTGANIQQNLYALHHIDVPWKPSDFERAPVKAAI